MESEDLLRRAQDLWDRCERTATVTNTGFLTPAQQYTLEAWAKNRPDCQLVLQGGYPQAERKVAFFLPFWMEADCFEPDQFVHAVQVTAGFGQPGHRDYLGAILALGISRQWIGDILVQENTAYVLCLPSMEAPLLQQLDHVGRLGVKTTACVLEHLPQVQRTIKKRTFTVQSMRLDAVAGGMFCLSRTQSAEKIRLGLVSLNYELCIKTDAPVKPGDVISIRGVGKGSIAELGGKSRKERLFLQCELWQ